MSNSFNKAHPQEDIEHTKYDYLHLQEDIKNINTLKGLAILVVYEEKEILVLITYILESYGIKVMTASSASAAFEIIKKSKLDLLIADIDLPENSTYWLIQKIRKLPLPHKREIPAIAFSSKAEDKAQKQAMSTTSYAYASGFQTYIKKPSNPTLLITEVAKLISLSCKSSPSLFGDYSCFS